MGDTDEFLNGLDNDRLRRIPVHHTNSNSQEERLRYNILSHSINNYSNKNHKSPISNLNPHDNLNKLGVNFSDNEDLTPGVVEVLKNLSYNEYIDNMDCTGLNDKRNFGNSYELNNLSKKTNDLQKNHIIALKTENSFLKEKLKEERLTIMNKLEQANIQNDTLIVEKRSENIKTKQNYESKIRI